MKITRILAYRVELPLHETTYKWSGGKSVTVRELPLREQIDVPVREQLIVELYSK